MADPSAPAGGWSKHLYSTELAPCPYLPGRQERRRPTRQFLCGGGKGRERCALQSGPFATEPGAAAIFVPPANHGRDRFFRHRRNGFRSGHAPGIRAVRHHEQDFLVGDIEVLEE